MKINLKSSIIELLAIDLDQWSKLENRFAPRTLQKAYDSTIKYAINKEVFGRRKYFKECLKVFNQELKPSWTPPVSPGRGFDPEKYKLIWSEKPWAKQ